MGLQKVPGCRARGLDTETSGLREKEMLAHLPSSPPAGGCGFRQACSGPHRSVSLVTEEASVLPS